MAQTHTSSETFRPAATATRQRRILGLRVVDALLIGAVALVVCLASLPRLADFVRHSNEQDAQVALALLGPACSPTDGPPLASDPTDLSTWSSTLRHRLRDARPLESGEALLYHGYLFQLVPVTDGPPWLIARPRMAPRTGLAVYAWSPEAGLLEAKDATAEAWRQSTGDPPAPSPEGWRALTIATDVE